MLAIEAGGLNTSNLDDVRRNCFFGNSDATNMTGFPPDFDKRFPWFGFSFFYTGSIRGFQFLWRGDIKKAYIRYYADTWGNWDEL